MVDYETFSSLRMRRIFPTPPQSSRSFYDEEGPDRRSYDEEYYGGLWDEETLDGVFLRYPKAGAGQLGSMEAWASPQAAATHMPGENEPFTGPFTDQVWSANANVALASLELPVKIGSAEAEVRALAAGTIKASPYPDGARTTIKIKTSSPDTYYLDAIIHVSAGLLKLTIFRPDLVGANGSKSARQFFEGQWK